MLIHQYLQKNALKYPDHLAGYCDGLSIKYRDLDERSNIVATKLINYGIQMGDSIGIYLPKSLDLWIGLFGVFKSGGIYLPLELDLPPNRLKYIITDCNPKAIITTLQLWNEIFSEFLGYLLLIDQLNHSSLPEHPPVPVSLDDSAYIIYTSGSTGNPKGVEVSHSALMNRLTWQKKQYNLNKKDIILHKTPIGFDVSLWELLWNCMVGAKLVIAPTPMEKDPEAILKLIKKQKITIVHFVPSALQVFLEKEPCLEDTDLRLIICSGEALTYPTCKLFFQNNPNKKICLENLYGPTETAIDVTYYSVKEAQEIIPIGKPISNIEIYILDKNLKQVEENCAGELFISGIGLAKRYVNNHTLTDKNFLDDPFKGDGSKMYRSGDLASFLPDGTIRYIGRTDNQVKIRGGRIELEEIENILLRHAQLSSVIVVSTQKNQEDILIAYYTTYNNSTYMGTKHFRDFLNDYLPSYMIPSYFIQVKGFKFLANGKLNRKSVKNGEVELVDVRSSVDNCELLSDLESYIKNLFIELIGEQKNPNIRNIKKGESFFNIGGHSILVMKLIARIQKEYDVKITFGEFFEHASIEALVFLVKTKISHLNAKNPFDKQNVVNNIDLIPLSEYQAGIWVMEQLHPGNPVYNFPIFLKFQGELNITFLKKTLHCLTNKHPLLKATIAVEKGIPYFKIPLEIGTFEVNDVLLNESINKDTEAKTLINHILKTPFDLKNEALSRATIVHIENNEFLLLFMGHHLIFDGYAQEIFINDLQSIYDKLSKGELLDLEIHLPKNNKAENVEKAEVFWKKYLRGDERFDLFFTKKRPMIPSYSGGCYEIEIEKKIVQNLAENYDSNLFIFLLSLFKITLSKFSRQKEVVIGIPISVRKFPEEEQVLGFFLNVLPIKIDFISRNTIEKIVKSVEVDFLKIYSNRHMHFAKIIKELKITKQVDRHPLFQIIFDFDYEDRTNRIFSSGIEVIYINVPSLTSKFALTLHAKVSKDVIYLNFEYARSMFEETDIKALASVFKNFILNPKNLLEKYEKE